MDIKKYKKTIGVTCLLCLLPIVAGLILWDQLPDMMPTHFGVDNEPNGFMSKPIAVFVLPAVLVLIELLCVIGTSMDPKSKNISEKILVPVLWMMPVLSWMANGVMYASALGYKLNVGALFIIFIGAVYLVVGNYLPKNSQNYSIGIRTPWALNDENNWNYTNRIGGIVFTATGLFLLIMGIILLVLVKSKFLSILSFVVMIVSAIVPFIASYLYYKKTK